MDNLDGLKIMLNGTSEERNIRKGGKDLLKLSRQFGIQGPSEIWGIHFKNLDEKLKEYSGNFKDYFKYLIRETESIRRNAQCYNLSRHDE